MERMEGPFPESTGGYRVEPGAGLARMAEGWWTFVLRGALAILFGIAAIAWPRITVVALVWLFGAYVLVDGVIALVNAFSGKSTRKHVWPQVLMGILGICVGILAFAAPAAVGLALLVFIAVWALIMGVLLIAAAISLRKQMQHEWLLAASGALAIVFSFFLLATPAAGVRAVLFWIAAFAILFGIMLIVAGFRLKKIAKRWEESHRTGPTAMPGEPYGTADRPITSADRPSTPLDKPRAPDWPRSSDRPKTTERP
ncbi:MAG: HdeD family acid-resistance protein [Longimicrobiales bacterium]